MRHPRLTRAALALALAGPALAGCGDSLTTSPSLNGGAGPVTFTLVSVNAVPLPADVRNDASGRTTITQGTLTISGSSFAQTLTLAETNPGGATSTRPSATQGTVTLRGDRVEFHASDGGEWTGVLSGTRLDVAVTGNNGAVSFSFQRT